MKLYVIAVKAQDKHLKNDVRVFIYTAIEGTSTQAKRSAKMRFTKDHPNWNIKEIEARSAIDGSRISQIMNI